MSVRDIKLALVVDTNAIAYDEASNNVQVVDIKGIQPVGLNLFIIQTKPFDDAMLIRGAGETLSRDQIDHIIQILQPHH